MGASCVALAWVMTWPRGFLSVYWGEQEDPGSVVRRVQ